MIWRQKSEPQVGSMRVPLFAHDMYVPLSTLGDVDMGASPFTKVDMDRDIFQSHELVTTFVVPLKNELISRQRENDSLPEMRLQMLNTRRSISCSLNMGWKQYWRENLTAVSQQLRHCRPPPFAFD